MLYNISRRINRKLSMQNISYVFPRRIVRSKRTSGAGVPVIFNRRGLLKGEGMQYGCFNLTVGEQDSWYSDQELRQKITNALESIARRKNQNFLLTKLHLGPTAPTLKADFFRQLYLPDNLALCGFYQQMLDPTYFACAVFDLRTIQWGEAFPKLDAKLDRLGARYSKPYWLFDSPLNEKIETEFGSFIEACKIDGDDYVMLNRAEILQFSTACLILVDEMVDRKIVSQLQFWCQLYGLPVRMCSGK